jgi:hypothetical protein
MQNQKLLKIFVVFLSLFAVSCDSLTPRNSSYEDIRSDAERDKYFNNITDLTMSVESDCYKLFENLVLIGDWELSKDYIELDPVKKECIDNFYLYLDTSELCNAAQILVEYRMGGDLSGLPLNLSQKLKTYFNSDCQIFGGNQYGVTENWYPVGFKEFATGLAYKRAGNEECNQVSSNTYGVCLEFITNIDCPSYFYAAISLKNESGQVIDSTNNSLPALPSGQIALLTFEWFTDGVDSVVLSDISCY